MVELVALELFPHSLLSEESLMATIFRTSSKKLNIVAISALLALAPLAGNSATVTYTYLLGDVDQLDNQVFNNDVAFSGFVSSQDEAGGTDALRSWESVTWAFPHLPPVGTLQSATIEVAHASFSPTTTLSLYMDMVSPLPAYKYEFDLTPSYSAFQTGDYTIDVFNISAYLADFDGSVEFMLRSDQNVASWIYDYARMTVVYNVADVTLFPIGIDGNGSVTGGADGIEIRSIPEPASLVLFGLGFAGLGTMRRMKLAA